MSGPTETRVATPGRRRLAFALLRCVVLVLVVVGVGRRVWLEREKLRAYDQPIAWGWLGAAGGCYLAGLVPSAVFWHMAMRDRGTPPVWARTLAAYFAGHLGKYVPGKGLVVVVRAGMLRERGVPLAIGAITCAHETLLMMGIGALVAAAILPMLDVSNRPVLFVLALSLGCVLSIGAAPPVVARWASLVTRPFGQLSETAATSSPWRTVFCGATMIAFGWLLMGASFAAVLAAMHELGPVANRFGAMPAAGLLTVVVTLATVGGFVSMTPGGLGSREWIVVETLGSVVGAEKAVIAAVLLRVAWIATESLGTVLFWLVDARCRKPNALAR